MKSARKRVVSLVATLFTAATLGLTAIAPASAATVPNRYYCNPTGGWCYQVNGAHVAGLPDVCHWKRSGMSGKPHQMYYTNCDWWEQDVP